ncbi:GSCFA domain-containing protein [Gluconacetobacter entanii]|uniref:GSCFA domain-containing protein n=1 Tax=Gluconacetobacter entanii TaxID=108528 RepID=UPI001C9335EF|nr:GSCFA domain-containing protein [Gluconacetobacter entanii]MBY4638435.1 GSCFA domain-containing protein [Gluconacetobacter entanii]MCW4578928.1 GSCFA domain-containing protein [Gluconacetobacter entanii]MCW4582310.1 GSCFA domain-containing protein [Gluconacetobacter entanii]MCW4585691.1 GSCFA domain-containing protein [Gluconacetobacter entanii]
MTNPYRNIPARQFWRKAVSNVAVHRLDLMGEARFKVSRETRVATAGSCFAQHISRKISSLGFNYFVTEDGGSLSKELQKKHNYGVFSARYGNIYTVAQLWQLFEEAYGRHIPAEHILKKNDGRFVDLHRQQIEPDGFSSEEELLKDRQVHLAAVRRIFEETDVFVFTLGLTEAWRSRTDGSVYSMAPGVVGGSYDPNQHEFVNYSIFEVERDLFTFLDALKTVNPRVKVILTVSPVPLIATYEPQHVLVSTTYSKSVLRVAAEDARKRYDWVDYFPSYEIITGSPTGGMYYEQDDREVNHLGVAHVMRNFMAHFVEGYTASQGKTVIRDTNFQNNYSEIICDEEVLARART